MKLINKLMMLALVAGVVCACEKDGDETGAGDATPQEIKISYSYSNTDDFFELMNVSVEYLDKEGTLQVVTIEDDWKYEATIPYASAPKEYKFVVKYSAAVQGLEETKENYTFQKAFNATVTKVFSNGETQNVANMLLVDHNPLSMSGSKINEYLETVATEKTIPFEASLEE